MDLQDIEWGGHGLHYLAQISNTWWAVVNAVMNVCAA
jgi:hypothetical protein